MSRVGSDRKTGNWIPWHRRLEARVLAFVFVVATGCLGAFWFSAECVLTSQSTLQAEIDFASARASFDYIARDRLNAAAAQCELIGSLRLRRALADPGEGASGATPHLPSRRFFAVEGKWDRKKLGASFLVITDRAPRWLAKPGWPRDARHAPALQTAVFQALGGKPSGGLLNINDHLYLVTVQPVRAARHQVLGTLTAGYLLDDDMARGLAWRTRMEVAFVADGQIAAASSRVSEERRELAKKVHDQPNLVDLWKDPSLRKWGTNEYITGAFPLMPASELPPAGRLVLMQPWAPTQRLLDAVNSALMLVGAITCAVALAAGLLVSGRITRALREVADTAEEIAAGNWDRQAPVKGTAEAAMLGTAFNQMTANVRHWYNDARLKSDRLSQTLEQLQDSYTSTLQALSRALDARDNETEGHSLRVTHYALRLGERMGLDAETRSTLKLGALLHDIGKIGVPDAILRKPQRLSPEEMELMRRHCEYGLAIVKDVPHLERAADVIRCHHERYDGHGYPAGLEGVNIPLVARVFAVADTLDAMTSNRPYRAGCSFPQALNEIRQCSGSQFDPAVVRALEAVASELEEWHAHLAQQPESMVEDLRQPELDEIALPAAPGVS